MLGKKIIKTLLEKIEESYISSLILSIRQEILRRISFLEERYHPSSLQEIQDLFLVLLSRFSQKQLRRELIFFIKSFRNRSFDSKSFLSSDLSYFFSNFLFLFNCNLSIELRIHLFPTQIEAILLLLLCYSLDMKTGEGKTIVAIGASALFSLLDFPAHVVTQNDFLAERDSILSNRLLSFTPLTVSFLSAVYSFNTEEKQKRYDSNILYASEKELIFDFLRDELELRWENTLNRSKEYSVAIIDEIDSILIDNANQPFVISGEELEISRRFLSAEEIAQKLSRNKDYEVFPYENRISLLERGLEKIRKLPNSDSHFRYLLSNALQAKEFYRKDRDYIVEENRIILIDKNTRRLSINTTLSYGLHQAIEAKEGVPISIQSRTYNSISVFNFFQNYYLISGLSGTAMDVSTEIKHFYHLDTIKIEKNRKERRIDLEDAFFETEKEKIEYLLERVKKAYSKGTPILIGTKYIYQSEILNQYLEKDGIPCKVLNAKNAKIEADVIAEAGKKFSVLIATMAGRGTDIILGGSDSSEEERKEINDLGGLFIIGFENYDSIRNDSQFRGRAGRQGDEGRSIFLSSFDDEIFEHFLYDFPYTTYAFLLENLLGGKERNLFRRIINNIRLFQEKENFYIRSTVIARSFIENYLRTEVIKNLKRVGERNLISNIKSLFSLYFNEYYNRNFKLRLFYSIRERENFLFGSLSIFSSIFSKEELKKISRKISHLSIFFKGRKFYAEQIFPIFCRRLIREIARKDISLQSSSIFLRKIEADGLKNSYAEIVNYLSFLSSIVSLIVAKSGGFRSYYLRLVHFFAKTMFIFSSSSLQKFLAAIQDFTE